MFDRFISLVTRYPLWIAGGVVAVVLLIWFSSGSSSGGGSPTIVSVGPSDQTVAANAMIEATRLENQRAGAAGVIAKELAAIQADSYALFLGTSKSISEIDAAKAVDLATVTKDMNTSLASIVTGATTTQTQIIVDGTKELATIDKNKATDLASITAALRKEEIAGANAAAAAAASAAVTIESIRSANEAAIHNSKMASSSAWWFATNPDNMASLWGVAQGDNVTNINVGQPNSSGIAGN